MNLLIINGISHEIKDDIVADVCLRLVQRSQAATIDIALQDKLSDCVVTIAKYLKNKSDCFAG
jgi:hypothetical protein